MEHPAVATNHDGITELIVSGITIPSVKSRSHSYLIKKYFYVAFSLGKRQLHGIPGRGEDVLLPTAQRDDNSLVPVNPPAESFGEFVASYNYAVARAPVSTYLHVVKRVQPPSHFNPHDL